MNAFRQVRRYYQFDCAPWRDQGERTQARDLLAFVDNGSRTLRHRRHPIGAELVSLLVASIALTRKAIELAKAGDTIASRLCLERLAPPRKDRPIQVALPALQEPADAIAAVAALLQVVAAGELTPGEGEAVAKLLEMHRRAVELVDLEDRISRLEQQNGMRP